LTRRVVAEADVNDDHALVVDAPTVPIAVDAPKVERIVENLVVNAAKHTAAGTTIWVGVQAQRDGVLLLVEDEGPGVQSSNRSSSSSPSIRAATSPTTPPVQASAWRWSPSLPACTTAAPGSRTAPAAAPPSESSSPTFRARTLPVPEPSVGVPGSGGL
jgi:hypothetical protein